MIIVATDHSAATITAPVTGDTAGGSNRRASFVELDLGLTMPLRIEALAVSNDFDGTTIEIQHDDSLTDTPLTVAWNASNNKNKLTVNIRSGTTTIEQILDGINGTAGFNDDYVASLSDSAPVVQLGGPGVKSGSIQATHLVDIRVTGNTNPIAIKLFDGSFIQTDIDGSFDQTDSACDTVDTVTSNTSTIILEAPGNIQIDGSIKSFDTGSDITLISSESLLDINGHLRANHDLNLTGGKDQAGDGVLLRPWRFDLPKSSTGLAAHIFIDKDKKLVNSNGYLINKDREYVDSQGTVVADISKVSGTPTGGGFLETTLNGEITISATGKVRIEGSAGSIQTDQNGGTLAKTNLISVTSPVPGDVTSDPGDVTVTGRVYAHGQVSITGTDIHVLNEGVIQLHQQTTEDAPKLTITAAGEFLVDESATTQYRALVESDGTIEVIAQNVIIKGHLRTDNSIHVVSSDDVSVTGNIFAGTDILIVAGLSESKITKTPNGTIDISELPPKTSDGTIDFSKLDESATIDVTDKGFIKADEDATLVAGGDVILNGKTTLADKRSLPVEGYETDSETVYNNNFNVHSSTSTSIQKTTYGTTTVLEEMPGILVKVGRERDTVDVTLERGAAFDTDNNTVDDFGYFYKPPALASDGQLSDGQLKTYFIPENGTVGSGTLPTGGQKDTAAENCYRPIYQLTPVLDTGERVREEGANQSRHNWDENPAFKPDWYRNPDAEQGIYQFFRRTSGLSIERVDKLAPAVIVSGTDDDFDDSWISDVSSGDACEVGGDPSYGVYIRMPVGAQALFGKFTNTTDPTVPTETVTLGNYDDSGTVWFAQTHGNFITLPAARKNDVSPTTRGTHKAEQQYREKLGGNDYKKEPKDEPIWELLKPKGNNEARMGDRTFRIDPRPDDESNSVVLPPTEVKPDIDFTSDWDSEKIYLPLDGLGSVYKPSNVPLNKLTDKTETTLDSDHWAWGVLVDNNVREGQDAVLKVGKKWTYDQYEFNQQSNCIDTHGNGVCQNVPESFGNIDDWLKPQEAYEWKYDTEKVLDGSVASEEPLGKTNVPEGWKNNGGEEPSWTPGKDVDIEKPITLQGRKRDLASDPTGQTYIEEMNCPIGSINDDDGKIHQLTNYDGGFEFSLSPGYRDLVLSPTDTEFDEEPARWNYEKLSFGKMVQSTAKGTSLTFFLNEIEEGPSWKYRRGLLCRLQVEHSFTVAILHYWNGPQCQRGT